MSWHHVERTTITAPRNLKRPDQAPIVRTMPDGGRRTIYPDGPSVGGGEVAWHHDIWRCGHCRALATTGGKCMKCHS